MKNLLLLLILLGSFSAHAAPDPYYGRQITVDSRLQGSETAKAAADLEFCLEQATGKDFTLLFSNTPATTGIQIFTAGQMGLPEGPALNRLSPEACLVKDAGDRLLLSAAASTGLPLAVYTYLDGLGFRWYFPGGLWTITPRLTSIRPLKAGIQAPAWRTRRFFGTGGIVPLPGLDPERRLPDSWTTWSNRNRLGGEMELKGHYGEWFNEQHRKELEVHPEYLALVGGKRVPWSQSAKHCISNAALRKLYINDRLKEAMASIAARSYAGQPVTVTVDPSDGGGHCECSECAKMGSVSDRVFYMANEVARALKPLGARVYASLYAYNVHAAPPKFSLADNLIVQVIPYAFQQYGTPAKMIDDWNKKSRGLFIYDYYGLTDWHYNLPLSDRWSTDTLLDHFRYWTRKNIQGFNLESSYSIVSSGKGLFLAARYGWNGNFAAAEEDLFFRHLFGSEEGAARAFFDRLDHGFKGANDAIYLLHDLEAARQRSRGEQATRFLHLQAYTGYLLRYYGWRTADPKDAEARWTALMSYIYRLYFTGLVHTTRLAEMFIWQSNLPAAVTDPWSPYKADAARIRATRPFSDSELAKEVSEDLRNYPLLPDFPYRRVAGRSYRATKGHTRPANHEGMMILDMPDAYVMPGRNGKVTLEMQVNTGTIGNVRQEMPVALVDTQTGKRYAERKVVIDTKWKPFVLEAPAGKVYRLEIRPPTWFRLRVPQDQWLAFANISTQAVLFRLYFYLPPATRYLYFSSTGTGMPRIYNEKGQAMSPEAVNDRKLYRIPVPASAAGTWWAIDEAQYQFIQFFGKPDLFFLHPNYQVQ